MIVTRRSICRTITSMCLSWIDTPWRAVHLLDLLDEVDLHLAGALHAQHLVRVGRAFHQLLADLDVVAVGEQPLGAVVVLEHAQPLTLGELVVDDFLATVVGDDGDLVEARRSPRAGPGR